MRGTAPGRAGPGRALLLAGCALRRGRAGRGLGGQSSGGAAGGGSWVAEAQPVWVGEVRGSLAAGSVMLLLCSLFSSCHPEEAGQCLNSVRGAKKTRLLQT